MIERDFILETRTKLPTVSPADIHSQQAQTQGSCSSTCAAVKSLVAVPCSTGIEPFQVNRKGLNALFTSPRLVRRMEAAGWFEVIRAGKPGRETLYDYASVKMAYQRYRNGEEPPLLPYEQRGERAGGAR